MPYIKYIQDEQHYREVLSKVSHVKKSVWIGTADIKDLYIEGKPFRYQILCTSLERVLCPRVHFKMIIFDYSEAYIGSANLTGAGIGMKGSTRRNFEAGILTDDCDPVDAAAEQFDKVWRGGHCKGCGRKDFCGDPIK